MNLRRLPWMAIVALTLAQASWAIEFQAPQQYLLPAEESVADELWLLATEADVHGTMENDFFVAGNLLTLAGTHRGDVWAAGGEVYFSGQADRHARLLGRKVTVSGVVRGNLLAGGTAVEIEGSARVEGQSILAAETVVAEGALDGATRIYADRATLGGRCNGNVFLSAQDIVVRPGAEIMGDLVYVSPRDLILDQRVVLHGELRREEPAETTLQWPTLTWRQALSLRAAFLAAALIVALPFLAAFSRFAGRSVRILRAASWKCLLTGVLAFSLVPLVVAFAFVTLVGIPLSVLLAALYGLMLYAAKFIVAMAVGGALLKRRGPQPYGQAFGALLVGLVAFYLLTLLPFVGGALLLLTLWLGLGAMVLALFLPDAPEPALPPPLPPPACFPRNDNNPNPAPDAPKGAVP